MIVVSEIAKKSAKSRPNSKLLRALMKLDDLEVFVGVVNAGTLAKAAEQLHQSTSALSKALRRLERDVNTPLFDREGKALKLNDSGEKLYARALQLMQMAEQTKYELSGAATKIHCRIAAPAVVLWRYGAQIVQALNHKLGECTLSIQAMFEDEAAAALTRGEVDFALTTSAINSTHRSWAAHWQVDVIGELRMQLMAARKHLLLEKGGRRFSTKAILQHDFACPAHSPFCGVLRGAHADGWRDDQLPRRIRYWMDDLLLLLATVQSGLALAYLPDFVAKAHADLVRIQVSDCPYECIETIQLLHAPSLASGWIKRAHGALLKAM
jgi:DNA-binding transcriptional LysR family regulator